jgi:hypothetical protein
VKFSHSGMLVLAAALAAALSTAAAAQSTQPNPLLTQRGWEIGGQVAHYKYEEPNVMKLEGERVGFVGAYTATAPNRVYTRIDLRVSYGLLEYESPLSGTLDDVPDWLGEARVVVGRDYLPGDSYALSPYIGFGYRYLYNDLRGYTSVGDIGYRRFSRYYYIPVGLTARFRAGGRWVIAPTVEYDWFLKGQQESKLSDVAPGLPDIKNDQENGRGYRAYLMLENGRWAVGPWFHYWKIKDSEIVPIAPGVGLVEPENSTREYGVELRFRF